MAARRVLRRLASPAGFLLVAGCFLLPFVTVSCGSPGGSDTVRASYSGVDLAAGRVPNVEKSETASPVDEITGLAAAQGYPRPISRQPLLSAALVLIALGALMALVPRPWWRALTTSAAAALALMVLSGGMVTSQVAALDRAEEDLATLTTDRTGSGPLLISAGLAYGYYLAMAGLVALALGSAAATVVHSRRIADRSTVVNSSGGRVDA
jgi:hypothetical protein